MASVLGDTSCVIHPDRQAIARCPSCLKFYCQECITEHEGRLTCSVCLKRESEKETVTKPKRDLLFFPWIQVTVAIAVCWILFYLLGGFLGGIPDEFHDGTIWEAADA